MSPHILTFAFLFSKVEQKDEAEGVCTRKSAKVKSRSVASIVGKYGVGHSREG